MPPVMVTAWAAQTRMALANTQAPGNNEAAGALQLIELIQLKGFVVTADALHCHRAMAKAIIDRGGGYVLTVKENQPARLADAKAAIEAARRKGVTRIATTELNHGRTEKRSAIVAKVAEMGQNHDFPGLKAVACITSKRANDETVSRYFLMSQAYSHTKTLSIVRQHWGIENSLHWPLDVPLDEYLARNPPIWPSSSASLSTSHALSQIPPYPCAQSSNAQNGTTPSSSTCNSLAHERGRTGWPGGRCRPYGPGMQFQFLATRSLTFTRHAAETTTCCPD